MLSSTLRDYGICRVFLLLHSGKILSYTLVDNGICANNTSSLMPILSLNLVWSGIIITISNVHNMSCCYDYNYKVGRVLYRYLESCV